MVIVNSGKAEDATSRMFLDDGLRGFLGTYETRPEGFVYDIVTNKYVHQGDLQGYEIEVPAVRVLKVISRRPRGEPMSHGGSRVGGGTVGVILAALALGLRYGLEGAVGGHHTLATGLGGVVLTPWGSPVLGGVALLDVVWGPSRRAQSAVRRFSKRIQTAA